VFLTALNLFGLTMKTPSLLASSPRSARLHLALAAASSAEFKLGANWQSAISKLDWSAPFNFVCSADIIGGNSGSSVVQAKGDLAIEIDR